MHDRTARAWAGFVTRHRRIVLAVWGALVAASAIAYPALENRLAAPDFTVDDGESTIVDQLVTDYFPTLGTEQDLIVFDSATASFGSASFEAAVHSALEAARATVGVVSVVAPLDTRQISADGHTAFAVAGLSGDSAARAATAHRLEAAFADLPSDVVHTRLVGYSPIQNAIVDAETRDVAAAEALGIPVAFVLLVLALGALVAALLPVSVALAGIALCVGVLFVGTSFTTLTSLVVSISSMIGIGIGIDYSMFMVSRFREELVRRGVSTRADQAGIAASLTTTLHTTGRNITASGLIVVISLCSLFIVSSPIFRGIAIGVAAAVATTLLASLTLLPALLAELGPAVDRGGLPQRWRPADTRADRTDTAGRWARWARTVMRRPVVFGLAGGAALLVAAYPLTDIRYGIDMGLPALADTATGAGLAIVGEKFEPGLLSPLEIVVTGPGEERLDGAGNVAVERFVADLRSTPGVADVYARGVDGRMLVTAIPTMSFDTTEAADLVVDVRSAAADVAATNDVRIWVGGSSAEFVDISDEIGAKFPWVVALVLASSMLFLIVVFRSLLLPVKAIAMNLLATGAALGATVAIFQWGWGSTLLDFTSAGFLQVFLPTVVFAMLFGLSMDYEVFLIGRMKEEWDGGDPTDPLRNEHAVSAGIEHTARPITAAAAIMVAIFGSFATASVLELQQIGLALAIAVAIDAVIVRLVLVPAAMKLMGRWNWYLPSLSSRARRSSAGSS